jgi:hypothetical protein
LEENVNVVKSNLYGKIEEGQEEVVGKRIIKIEVWEIFPQILKFFVLNAIQKQEALVGQNSKCNVK